MNFGVDPASAWTILAAIVALSALVSFYAVSLLGDTSEIAPLVQDNQ